jgi:hypothetical protein
MHPLRQAAYHVGCAFRHLWRAGLAVLDWIFGLSP